jgi:hypothetical protein
LIRSIKSLGALGKLFPARELLLLSSLAAYDEDDAEDQAIVRDIFLCWGNEGISLRSHGSELLIFISSNYRFFIRDKIFHKKLYILQASTRTNQWLSQFRQHMLS